MGDYNSPESSTRYRRLQQWILDQSATERSPDEATLVKGNKLDLIITKDDPENDVITKIYHNGAVENSDHKCQSISIPLPILPTPINTKTDYRKLDIEDMLERIGKLPEPKNTDELINQLESIRQTLKTVRSGNKTRLPLKVLAARRKMNRSKRTSEHTTARLEYRQAFRDHINDEIDKTLDEVETEREYFELNKRGNRKKIIPAITDSEEKRYQDHADIALFLAKQHGEGDLL